MKDLEEMTAAELVAVHNGRCPPGDAIAGTWKASKAELIARVRALGEPPEADEPEADAEAAADRRVQTIGALVAELLLDPDLSYAEIVERVKAQFPEARTTARSVASVAATMRRDGVGVPTRRGASK